MDMKQMAKSALLVVGVVFVLGLAKAAFPTVWAKIPGLNQF